MSANCIKKVLVLGGTGAMGVYLLPELVTIGYHVTAVSLDNVTSDNPCINYIQANAKDDSYLYELLQSKYDAIVDFMIYSTKEFSNRYEMMLGSTNHYIYLSSYRVYADSNTPIKEDTARLLDVSNDKAFLATEDYSLYKARQEDILRASNYDNWTIVRPAITYSKYRYQLITLEADTVIYRALNKLPVFLPENAMSVQGTMSWAGDVAEMMSRLVLNSSSLKETYTVATSEHHTWEEIASCYKDIIGLDYETVDAKTYLDFFGPNNADGARYQLLYDRCFNRIIDNSKVLKATGLKQADLTPLKKGLERELSALPQNTVWSKSKISERMDAFSKVR